MKYSATSIKKSIRKPQTNRMITFFKTIHLLPIYLFNATNIIAGTKTINPKRIMNIIASITM